MHLGENEVDLFGNCYCWALADLKTGACSWTSTAKTSWKELDGCCLLFFVDMWGFVWFQDDTRLLWVREGVLCVYKLALRQPVLFCRPRSQQNLLAVLHPHVDAGQDRAVLEIEAADFKLAWVPTHQAQRYSFRYPSAYTCPAGSPLIWQMLSTSCGTSCFPGEMSYICPQGWGPWHGMENHRDGRMHHGPLLIFEAPGGVGNAWGCASRSGGVCALLEPAIGISMKAVPGCCK